MKKTIRQLARTILFSLPVVLGGVFLSSSQVFAGSWSTEYNLEGMDSVHIYLPSTSPTVNGKRALMINLHGCDMSNTDMKNYADWKPSADEFGMVVALPDVPGSGSFTDCWTYYGENHTRYNNHNDEVIDLAKELMSRSSLNIDPDQVYITGFSSGAGEANIVGCLAPDIFAGVGASAGPGLGTGSYSFSSVPAGYSDSSKAELCERLAGSYASDLDTQVYSTVHGTSDTIIATGYNAHNADTMSIVYGANSESSARSISGSGTEVISSDGVGPRVSMITVSYMGHDWSTGDGGNSGYFTNTKVDYPNYVTQWFFDNNRRVSGDEEVDADGDGSNEYLDCNDFDNSIFPGAIEICEDGIDQNCSGSDSMCGDGGSWVCVEYTDSNANHLDASRVTSSTTSTESSSSSGWGSWGSGYGSYDYSSYYSGYGSGGSTDTTTYYAVGSGEELSGTAQSTSTVSETSEGYFESGSCP